MAKSGKAVESKAAAQAGVEADALAPTLEAEPIVLKFEDLLPDADGEIVLFAEEDVPVAIITDETVADSGIVEDHVTAAGVDVYGLHFYSFENGITLYSLSDVSISDGTAAG